MKDKNIDRKTIFKFVFPLFEYGENSIDEQLTRIASDLILMKQFLNEPSEEILINYNEKMGEAIKFDFYNYQKQNMNTDYSFFTSENYKHAGYNIRKIIFKSQNDTIYNLKIQLAKNLYNITAKSLVKCKENENEFVSEQFENWYELNSIRFTNEKSPVYYEADDNELFDKLFKKINQEISNKHLKEAA